MFGMDPFSMLTTAAQGDGMSMPGSNPGTQGPAGGLIVGSLSGGNTPQARGQGLGQQAPFEQYGTGPGLTWSQYDPYAASRGQNQGMDMTGPGFGENFYTGAAQRFMQPGAASQYWNQVQGTQAMPTTAHSQREYMGLQEPNIAEGPGLDPYYDRQRRVAADAINNQFGSRGMFGSSAAMGQIGDTFGMMGAEQANREADYALQRLGEQRAWESLSGQLAGQADAMSRANQQQQLAWLQGMGGLAANADQADLSRLIGGMNSAGAAQQMREGRLGDMFDRQMGMSNALARTQEHSYDQMINDELGLFNDAIMTALGLAGEGRNQDYRRQEKIKDDERHAMDMFGGIMGAFTGGIGG